MYFPTSAARQLSSVPALPDLPLEGILSLEPSPRKSLFCALTQHAITVWRVRVRSIFTHICITSESHPQPSTPLAYLARSETSLIEHGDNLAATWSPDGSRIVIQVSSSPRSSALLHYDMFQTAFSYLVLVTVDHIPDVVAYQPPDIPPGVQRNFLAGPGEGLSLQSLSLSFEGVIRAEGQVLR